MGRMAKLEDLQPNAALRGVLPDCPATVVGVNWLGPETLELTSKDPIGKVGNMPLHRHDEPCLTRSACRRPDWQGLPLTHNPGRSPSAHAVQTSCALPSRTPGEASRHDICHLRVFAKTVKDVNRREPFARVHSPLRHLIVDQAGGRELPWQATMNASRPN